MTDLRYTSTVDHLPASVPFVGPETQERMRGQAFDARLGANENVFGPSPKAVAAMQASLSEVWKYGDATSHDLRHALGQHLAIAPEHFVIGEGIDGLLGYLVRMFIEPGDAVVTSAGAYPTFNYHVTGYGGHLHQVPFRDDGEDLPALLAKAREVNAKLVYFSNPDNPMGTFTNGQDIERQLDNIPAGTLLILDEAYIEFAPKSAIPNIAADDPRVIRTRTFSKAYAMAGARVGYAFGAASLMAQFEKIRNHFGMNRTAQIGALAALQDQDWLARIVDQVAHARDRISQIAQDNGLNAIPSATNFVAVDCGQDGDFATRVLQALGQAGIFVRKPFVAPQDRCIRISAGTDQDLNLLATQFPIALETARASA